MGFLRKLSAEERHLLEVLVKHAKGLVLSVGWQDDLLVEPMTDGGMGSLKLIPSNASSYRKLGEAVSNIEFNDADGVKVFAALNVDQNGHLFEIDVWKTDFSPLIRIPKHFS
jgi:uncharacterized protein DUF6984